MAFLSAHDISLTCAKKLILDQINFAINEHEFIGLIGPNGAGKSSLLSLLAGLTPHAQGKVLLAPNAAAVTTDALTNQERAKFIGYLPQNHVPAWPLSAKNIVALGRTAWQTGFSLGSDDEAAIAHAMEMTDVLHLAERAVTELSGGEQQRVLLARVFAGKPKLILADEPIAALDIYHQLHIMELLQQHAQNGGAVLAALHDLSLAARFCSRLLLIHQGQVIADGSPIEVLTPENVARVYGVRVHIDCREEGVVVIPSQRI